MGRAKELFMEQAEGGWHSVGDKYACAKCFADYAIATHIEAEGEIGRCDYCRRRRKILHMDELLRFIAKGILRKYEDPANSVGYDSSEGGYLITPTDGYDLIDIVLEGSNDDLMEDLRSAFAHSHWVHRNPYSLTESEALASTWEAFCKQVKHQTRFLFQSLPASEQDHWDYGHSRPFDILRSIGSFVEDLDLTVILDPGSRIFRARQHGRGRFATAEELGSPPVEFARQNRMSPAGISRFYGGKTRAVARAETVDLTATEQQFLSMGEFRLVRPLRLLDLTDLPTMPSIFDEDRAHDTERVGFLLDFADDLAKPIERDGREHYEYVPTQIVAEYFQHVFRVSGGRTLDGIAFNSSKIPGHVCYVLFYGHASFEDSVPIELVRVIRERVKFPA